MRAVEPLGPVPVPALVNVPRIIVPLPSPVATPVVGAVIGCSVVEAAYAVDTADPMRSANSDSLARTESPPGIARRASAATPATTSCFVVFIVVSLVGRLGYLSPVSATDDP